MKQQLLRTASAIVFSVLTVTAIPTLTMAATVGDSSTVTDTEINDYIILNIDNPEKIAEGMRLYNVSLDRIQTTMGYTRDQMSNYIVQSNNDYLKSKLGHWTANTATSTLTSANAAVTDAQINQYIRDSLTDPALLAAAMKKHNVGLARVKAATGYTDKDIKDYIKKSGNSDLNYALSSYERGASGTVPGSGASATVPSSGASATVPSSGTTTTGAAKNTTPAKLTVSSMAELKALDVYKNGSDDQKHFLEEFVTKALADPNAANLYSNSSYSVSVGTPPATGNENMLVEDTSSPNVGTNPPAGTDGNVGNDSVATNNPPATNQPVNDTPVAPEPGVTNTGSDTGVIADRAATKAEKKAMFDAQNAVEASVKNNIAQKAGVLGLSSAAYDAAISVAKAEMAKNPSYQQISADAKSGKTPNTAFTVETPQAEFALTQIDATIKKLTADAKALGVAVPNELLTMAANETVKKLGKPINTSMTSTVALEQSNVALQQVKLTTDRLTAKAKLLGIPADSPALKKMIADASGDVVDDVVNRYKLGYAIPKEIVPAKEDAQLLAIRNKAIDAGEIALPTVTITLPPAGSVKTLPNGDTVDTNGLIRNSSGTVIAKVTDAGKIVDPVTGKEFALSKQASVIELFKPTTAASTAAPVGTQTFSESGAVKADNNQDLAADLAKVTTATPAPAPTASKAPTTRFAEIDAAFAMLMSQPDPLAALALWQKNYKAPYELAKYKNDIVKAVRQKVEDEAYAKIAADLWAEWKASGSNLSFESWLNKNETFKHFDAFQKAGIKKKAEGIREGELSSIAEQLLGSTDPYTALDALKKNKTITSTEATKLRAVIDKAKAPAGSTDKKPTKTLTPEQQQRANIQQSVFGETTKCSGSCAKAVMDAYVDDMVAWQNNAVSKCGGTLAKGGDGIMAPTGSNSANFRACAGLAPNYHDYEKGGSKFPVKDAVTTPGGPPATTTSGSDIVTTTVIGGSADAINPPPPRNNTGTTTSGTTTTGKPNVSVASVADLKATDLYKNATPVEKAAMEEFITKAMYDPKAGNSYSNASYQLNFSGTVVPAFDPERGAGASITTPVTNDQITKYIEANKGDPAVISSAMREYGVDLNRIAAAGYTHAQITQYVNESNDPALKAALAATGW